MITKINNENRLSNIDLIDFCTNKSLNLNKNNDQPKLILSSNQNNETKANANPVIKKPYLNLTKLNKFYNNRNYKDIFNEYRTILKNDSTQLNSKNLNLLTRSIYEANSLNLNEIKDLIKNIKEKNIEMGFNSIIDLFICFINKVNINKLNIEFFVFFLLN